MDLNHISLQLLGVKLIFLHLVQYKIFSRQFIKWKNRSTLLYYLSHLQFRKKSRQLCCISLLLVFIHDKSSQTNLYDILPPVEWLCRGWATVLPGCTVLTSKIYQIDIWPVVIPFPCIEQWQLFIILIVSTLKAGTLFSSKYLKSKILARVFNKESLIFLLFKDIVQTVKIQDWETQWEIKY